MKKSELIKYFNDHTSGTKIAGRKEFRGNDIFISSANDDRNYRLTRYGKDVIEKHFRAYKIKLSTQNVEVGSKIIAIDGYMHSPYYLTSNMLILYEENIAAELLLIDGDFDLWIKNKS